MILVDIHIQSQGLAEVATKRGYKVTLILVLLAFATHRYKVKPNEKELKTYSPSRETEHDIENTMCRAARVTLLLLNK